MKMNALNQLSNSPDSAAKMPALFLGHGSPMNAIEENEFVRGFREVGKTIPKPEAILCVSAHWETSGTFVTAMDKPKTIHDFGGFPQALYEVQYPAPGSPDLADETRQLAMKNEIGLDQKWGLDHGCWSVVKHLYPKADVPVIQLSLDYGKDAQHHYELAREKMKNFILTGNHQQLINYQAQGKAFDLAIPTPDHYLPLLYALALKDDDDEVSLFNDKAIAGSLTMTSVKIG
jgi:4,5-DOPA dioxygenase extradiol